ncbi:MAG TPA: hypothetical protein DEF42_17780 [Desulfosporosinus sp.]|nr:hypothetical protein [Desulfosporosinus sp.]
MIYFVTLIRFMCKRSGAMDTEVIATSAVKTSVSITDYLSPYISERDKEPIWDGNIYVFSHKRKSNEFCKGRVPVQVKSKESIDLTKDTITYPIRTDDLRKYLTENGAIYFVVYVCQAGNTRIYYTDLLPFKIKQLLNKAGKQKTISAALMQFPTDNTEKVDLFFNFLRDRDLQKSISNIEIMSIEELSKMGQLKAMSFGFTSTRKENSPFDYLFSHSVYIYATTPLGLKIPVDIMSDLVFAGTTLEKPVFCNGKLYYDNYEVVHKKDSGELHFGKSTIIKFKKLMNDFTLKFDLQGTLRQRITDEAFLINMLESLSINIGDINLPLKPANPVEIKSFRIEDRKEHLEHLRNVRLALDEVGVKDDLDCSDLSDIDEENIRILIEAFVHHKAVSFGNSEVIEPIGKMTIANLCIMLIARKQENNLYLLSNFFNDNIALRVKNEKYGEFDTSQFTIMNKENFLQLSNIDYEAIYNDFLVVKSSKLFHGQVIHLLLDMLLAYDESVLKNKELLKAAQKLSEWLMASCNDNENTYAMLLNYLQTIKRSRPLNEDEIKQLYSLVENGNVEDDILTAAYILLENSSGAKLHYDKLPPTEKEKFVRFPIYSLWNRI